MTVTALWNQCTACGGYHPDSTACPSYIPVGPPVYPPQQQFYVVDNSAAILATLQRIEALLERLLPNALPPDAGATNE